MRDRIWAELAQSKFNEEYASLYEERQRIYLKYFNIFILIFSAGGVMGWKLWDNIPMIACIIIAVVSLMRLLQPHIIISETQILNLKIINDFYFDYFNKIECLWFDYEDETINENEAKRRFFEIKGTETKINSVINEMMHSKSKMIEKKATTQTDDYLKTIFKTYKDE